MDRTEGVAKLNTAIQVIRESIEESEGQFNIKMEVREGGRVGGGREDGGKKGGGEEGEREEEGGREEGGKDVSA